MKQTNLPKSTFWSWVWTKGNIKERVAALVAIAIFTTILLFIPSQVPKMTGHISIAMSPRFFPYIVSISGIIMSFMALIQSFFAVPGLPKGGEGVLGKKELLRAYPVIVIAMVYVFLFNILGYIVTAILCFSALLWYYGVSLFREWKVAVALVILFPLIVYYIFKYQLYVPLPSGLLKIFGLY